MSNFLHGSVSLEEQKREESIWGKEMKSEMERDMKRLRERSIYELVNYSAWWCLRGPCLKDMCSVLGCAFSMCVYRSVCACWCVHLCVCVVYLGYWYEVWASPINRPQRTYTLQRPRTFWPLTRPLHLLKKLCGIAGPLPEDVCLEPLRSIFNSQGALSMGTEQNASGSN